MHIFIRLLLICDDVQYWVNAGIDLTLRLGSVHVSPIVLFDLIFYFVPVNYCGWSQHHIGSGGGRHYWYASYLGMRGCKKCQNQGVWCAEQHGSPCMSMFLAAIRHNVTRCHDMLHFLVFCWLKSRIMNHVATYFPSSKILKDMRREKVCAQAAANDNECLLNMSQQFDCWIRVRWSEWMQFESALLFCAAPGRVTAIVYSWRINWQESCNRNSNEQHILFIVFSLHGEIIWGVMCADSQIRLQHLASQGTSTWSHDKIYNSQCMFILSSLFGHVSTTCRSKPILFLIPTSDLSAHHEHSSIK